MAGELVMEELAAVASLSVFYFQRLFARLVKRPVREYIRLRRLACAAAQLKNGGSITDVAAEYGFGGREVFSRAFKEVYGLSPSAYRGNPVGLNNFDKPNLLLHYVMVDEGVPLITEGIVLEYHRRWLDKPVHFMGVAGWWQFQSGKMLGERPAVSEPAAIWAQFYAVRGDAPLLPQGRGVGVSYPGGAPKGYSTYFAGAEVSPDAADERFARWVLPAREYIVCQYEAEDRRSLLASMGKMMKFTRFWLKEHGLRAADFFPELYYNDRAETDPAYMEMWIPFTKREENKT